MKSTDTRRKVRERSCHRDDGGKRVGLLSSPTGYSLGSSSRSPLVRPSAMLTIGILLRMTTGATLLTHGAPAGTLLHEVNQ